MISLDCITKSYPVPQIGKDSDKVERLKILDSLSLSIEKGQSVSIIGSSGSGKSTLLNIIGLLDRIDSGKILMNGVDVTGMSNRELCRYRNKELGFIFQVGCLVPELTAEENVAVPLLLAGCGRKKALQKAREVLLKVLNKGELEHAEQIYKAPPAKLSGEQCQRVAIARAIIMEPDLILADEPTGSLDRETAAGVMDLIFELNSSMKSAVILVTHDEELAKRADRRYALRDKNLVLLS